MKISNKKSFIDFKDYSSENHGLALNYEEIIDEFWNDYILEEHGLPFAVLNPKIPNYQKISIYKSLILFSYYRNEEIGSFCSG